jgi:hypothetical protein
MGAMGKGRIHPPAALLPVLPEVASSQWILQDYEILEYSVMQYLGL